MNSEDNKVGWEFCLNKISRQEFIDTFSYNLVDDPDSVYMLLESAYNSRNKDEVELTLILASIFNTMNEGYVPLLCDLLQSDFHIKHEDIVSNLQYFADPISIDALYLTATSKFKYLEYDNSYALARKCIWALGSINNEEARDRLNRLYTNNDKEIRRYVEEQRNRK